MTASRFILLTTSILLAWTVSVSAQPPETAATYGNKVNYVGHIVRYPDFMIRFVPDASPPEHPPIHGRHYSFEVSNSGGQRISGFTHRMSGVYDPVQAFTVKGEVFAAEMFMSSAGQAASGHAATRLANEEIIVWNKPSASTGNLPLLKIWAKK